MEPRPSPAKKKLKKQNVSKPVNDHATSNTRPEKAKPPLKNNKLRDAYDTQGTQHLASDADMKPRPKPDSSNERPKTVDLTPNKSKLAQPPSEKKTVPHKEEGGASRPTKSSHLNNEGKSPIVESVVTSQNHPVKKKTLPKVKERLDGLWHGLR